MNKVSYLRKIALVIPAILLSSLAFSELTKDEARLYRDKGYEAQKNGDYDTALMFYEKAIVLDPSYTITYNDLGVLYEQMGDKAKAAAMYVRALQFDPNFKEVYYNLASLYEEEGNFLEAAFYWKQRVRLGDPGDIKTLIAREHLWQIGQIYPGIIEDLKKQEVLDLLSETQDFKKRAKDILTDRENDRQIKRWLYSK